MRSLPLVLLLSMSAVPAGAEMRGLWVVRTALVSPESVDRVVDEACRGGFNALFVQVRGRGDAFYTSRLAPRGEQLRAQPADFDPFRRLLAKAQARGLEVHAWVNVLLTAHYSQPLPEGHVLARHPEWVMVPKAAAQTALKTAPSHLLSLVESKRNGEEGFYLSPSAPGVAAHLEAIVEEIVGSYAIAGLHLDFIRYPGPDFDFSPPALHAFFRQRKGRSSLLLAPALFPEGWGEYQRVALDAVMERLSRAARRARPGVLISAAVVPEEAEAVHHKYQRWPGWVAKGLLDAVCPMAYTPDSHLFRQQVQEATVLLGGGRAVWAGVGAYRLSQEGILERIRLAREAGASGVVLFSHESLPAVNLDDLRRGAFSSGASSEGVAPPGAR